MSNYRVFAIDKSTKNFDEQEPFVTISTLAAGGKLSTVIEFPAGKVMIPINPDGTVKWFDDSRLIRK